MTVTHNERQKDLQMAAGTLTSEDMWFPYHSESRQLGLWLQVIEELSETRQQFEIPICSR